MLLCLQYTKDCLLQVLLKDQRCYRTFKEPREEKDVDECMLVCLQYIKDCLLQVLFKNQRTHEEPRREKDNDECMCVCLLV